MDKEEALKTLGYIIGRLSNIIDVLGVSIFKPDVISNLRSLYSYILDTKKVTYCVDCKWYNSGATDTDIWCSCKLYGRSTRVLDFCSRAERKEK